MDQFRLWKRYPRAMEGALAQAGYGDTEFSVHREDTRGAARACWSWHSGAAELTRDEWPSGLDLVWSSATGWSYQGRGDEKALALPVPVLAAPEAITALLPALMDGRRNQLPASEDRWEHAALIESGAETARLYGDDKYDAAYQRDEEEAAGFSRWQDQRDGVQPEATPRSASGHESPGPDTTQGTGDGAGRSGGANAEELARRTHVNVILDRGAKALDDRQRHPDPERFGVLTDFFTRAVVFPGQFDPEDDQLHTSDPSRVLAHLLLQHLERHGLDMDDVMDMELTDSAIAPVGSSMSDCIAQVLRGSRWFDFAAPGTDPKGGRVLFRTVFGTEGVLQVSGAPDAADGNQAHP
ncbi:hypothetical protein [Streptomyces griseoaurantiacus]|uniref:hypothetical protein n=1 Tax=Streptomyces griseoaurantiacus TaxID=68213 RepID=UPI0037F904AB